MMMHRRIPALLALLALVFSFAETAHAATCEQAAAAPMHHQMPGHGPGPAHHESMPNCPFNAAGQLGCSVTTSLPVRQTSLAPQVQEVATPFAGDVVLPHAERTTAIFHPPRF